MNNGGKEKMCVYSVSTYPCRITIRKGDEYNGAYAIVDAESNYYTDVTWYSDNTDVATVNASSGYIYAKSEGTAKIYVESIFDRSKKDYITVTVSSGTICVDSVTLDRTNLSLEKGDKFTLTATVLPINATDRTISWRSSNTDVATVSGGVVTAKAKGSTYIYAKSTDGSGKYERCYVDVTEDTLATSNSVNLSSKTMNMGDFAYLHSTICPTDETNSCIEWSSSDSSVVSVNPASGLVYAKKEGTASICATATDGSGCTENYYITVNGKVYVSDITLSSSAITLYKGNTYDLNAEVCPSNANNRTVRWYSCNSSIASINTYSGLVTAKSAGVTTVYAIAQDGSEVQDCCTVTVKQTSTCPQEDKGITKVPERTFQDPVDVYTGAHLIENSIMTLFGGQAIKLTAQYDSTKLLSGVFGKGWYHNYEKYLEIVDGVAYVYSGPSSYSRYSSNEDCTVYTCTAANKNGYVLTVDNCAEYPYAINCNSECTEYYNSEGKLAKIVDHQGFETVIAYTDSLITITDMVSGKKMYLEKDSTGKVTKVYDDADRQVIFTYTDGLITTICDMNSNSLNFTYNNDGQILTGTDSNGTCYFTNTYDEFGRVATQKDAIADSVTSTFTYNDDGTRITTDRNGNTSTRKFDSNGLLLSHTDENGNTKTYTYDDRYNIHEETDANGKSIVKVYNSFNKPVSITDKNGYTTEISYDDNGNVVKISYPEKDGVIPEEIFEYNSRNQLKQHTDLRGTVTIYTYDSSGMPYTKKVGSKNAIQYSYQNGLLKSQTDAMGYTTQYGHNKIGQVELMTNANGNITRYEYDAFGNLLKTTDANGNTITNIYDGNHQKTSVTDANGNITEYSYNGNMKNDVITLPDNNTIRYEFDGEDRPVKITDQANNVTIMTYDKGGRMITKQLPDGSITQYEYDKVGNLVKEINPNGAVTHKTYDANGNVLTVTDDNGNTTSYQYDNMNRVVKVTDALSGETTYTYNKAGDLLSSTNALEDVVSYTYDDFGNKQSQTDARGNTTTYTYDANDNLLTVKDALDNVTSYTYDSRNLLVSVTNAKNQTVTYGYDAVGKQISVTDAKNNTVYTEYDDAGNVFTVTDAKGNVMSTTIYNELNLAETVTNAAGNTTTYQYNNIGKPQIVTDVYGNRQEYLYDNRGNNIEVKDALNNVSEAIYDTFGNVTSLIGPLNGSTQYTYDTIGRLISETTSSGGTVNYGYNALNLKAQLANAKGQVRTYIYDAIGRITGYTSAEGSATYTYDKNSNILTATDQNGTVTREYDSLNRVTRYTDTLGNVIQYQYDLIGTPIIITNQPEDVAVFNCEDATITFNVTGDRLTYKWYHKNKDDVDFVFAPAFTDNTYTVTMSDERVGSQAYCIISDMYGNSLKTKTATLYKKNEVAIIKQPISVTISSGETATVSFEATGDGLTYKWYYKNKNSSSFAYTSSFTKNTYAVEMSDARAGRQIYCVVTDKYGNSVQTNTVTLNIGNSVKITSQPTSVTVANGVEAKVSFTATGDGLTYNWYYKNKNATEFLYTPTFKTRTYSAQMNSSREGRQVYCVVTDAYGNSVQTNTVTLNMTGAVKITKQPESVTVADGTEAKVNFTATGDGLTYNWYYKNKNATEFLYTPTFNTRTYSAQMNSSRDGRQVYCIVTDAYGNSAQTDTVTLNMIKPVIISKQPESVVGANGMLVKVNFAAVGEELTYKWYFKNRGSSSFIYTSTFNGDTYTAEMSDERAGRQIYCVVTDKYGNSVTTKTVTLNAKYYNIITYPDNTEVVYAYDANNNLVSVNDWANRVTTYSYDENNNVIGVTKPDCSYTTTVYDDAQRVVSTIEKTVYDEFISGFEYTYDNLSRIIEEKHLADNTKICYTYDCLSRVTNRTIKNECDEVISSESYTYDAAGNITSAPNSCFAYDTNNRLIVFNGNTVSYDMDGNMLNNGTITFEYDSANRLIKADDRTYTYNVEDVRVRNLWQDEDTTYTYNTNCKLSQLLTKTINGVTTKYVYGLGLIGEEHFDEFKTYHFDFRGSTVAITDEWGYITDTFKYDAYGNITNRTGYSFVLFGYNGRDGVVTDKNGLIYMRARYYSPAMRRFINADIVPGEISNAVTLNRYAYANGNPVSYVDPFGLSAERGGVDLSTVLSADDLKKLKKIFDYTGYGIDIVDISKESLYWYLKSSLQKVSRPSNISVGSWNKQITAELKWLDDVLGPTSKITKGIDIVSLPWLDVASVGIDAGIGIYENVQNNAGADKILWDATVDIAISGANTAVSVATGAAIGTAIPIPVVGTAFGALGGLVVGLVLDGLSNGLRSGMKSWVE